MHSPLKFSIYPSPKWISQNSSKRDPLGWQGLESLRGGGGKGRALFANDAKYIIGWIMLMSFDVGFSPKGYERLDSDPVSSHCLLLNYIVFLRTQGASLIQLSCFKQHKNVQTTKKGQVTNFKSYQKRSASKWYWSKTIVKTCFSGTKL